MSANTKMISLDSHKSWFFQVLNDNNKVMYIGQFDNQKLEYLGLNLINYN